MLHSFQTARCNFHVFQVIPSYERLACFTTPLVVLPAFNLSPKYFAIPSAQLQAQILSADQVVPSNGNSQLHHSHQDPHFSSRIPTTSSTQHPCLCQISPACSNNIQIYSQTPRTPKMLKIFQGKSTSLLHEPGVIEQTVGLPFRRHTLAKCTCQRCHHKTQEVQMMGNR